MHRRLTFIAAALAALAGLAILAARGDGDEGSTRTALPGLEARTIEAGAVTVKVEPRQLDDQGAVFAITLDTHSVDLSADLTRTATLTIDEVDWPAATWSGDGPGGHHRQGELRFEPSGPATGEVRLVIRGFEQPVEATWTVGG